MRPLSGGRRPASTWRRVDLPEPLGPVRPSRVPGPIVRSTPVSRRRGPTVTVRSRTEREARERDTAAPGVGDERAGVGAVSRYIAPEATGSIAGGTRGFTASRPPRPPRAAAGPPKLSQPVRNVA